MYPNKRRVLFLLISLCAGTSLAQTTSGSIAGLVVDPQQAAVNNARIVVSDESKAFTQTATTNSDGRFVFSILPPGTYRLTIEAKGFKKNERTGLLLVANDRLTLGELILEVGAANETVTITAEAALLQAESAERSYAVQGEIVRHIAVNGRGFTPLASITPGVVFHGVNNGSSDAITNISANGMRMNSNNLSLDGVTIVDTGNNGTLLSLNLDAIAEFKVLTSNYQAEYGRAAGAQISAVTRSGTRDFHGSFYGFRRHDGMNANTWINNRDSTPTNKINKPRLDQRDIGFAIGGPVYLPKVFNADRQKLFFFFNEEHQKRFNPPASATNVRVPTALERAGDFSQTRDNSGNLFPYIRDYASGAPCNASNTSGCFKDGGVLGRIPANRLSPIGLKILNVYPLPNTTVGANFNYQTELPSSQPQRQDLVRIDYNLNSAWRVYGRYVNVANNQTLPYGSFVLATNLPDYNVLLPNPRDSWSISATGSLNPSVILEVTVGGSHNSIDINPANPNFTRAGLGLSEFPMIYPNATQLDSPPQFIFNGGRIANGPNIGSNNSPFYNFNTTRDVAANLSKILHSHTMKAGVYWQNSYKPQSSFANNNGVVNFINDSTNPFDTGFGFANAAIGVYNSYQQASGYFIGKYRYNNLEWFVQDNWKASNRLTLDYGIRFYWIQPQYDEDLQTSNFLPQRFNASDAPRLYRPICINGLATCAAGSANRRAVDPAMLAPGFTATAANTIDGVYVGRIVPNSGNISNGVLQAGAGIEKGLYKNRGPQFAPRFGFAFDVMGDQTMVVRGGGGIFYDRPQGNTIFGLLQNPPTTLQPTFNFGRLQDINSNAILLGPPALTAFDREGKVSTSYSFNFGVQYKLPFDAVLDASYVGSTGSHLLQQRNINAPAYGAAYLPGAQDPTQAPGALPGQTALPVDFLRPYQGFGNIAYIEPSSSSNYHSLQTSLNRRYRKGLLVGVNYTWSKALGTQANDLPGVFGFGAPHNLDQRRANYGPQDFDRRHNFSVNWVWELPKATDGRLFGFALNGWQLSGIYRYQSGQPYNLAINISDISAYTLTGTQTVEGARIVVLGAPGSGHNGDPYRQFNPAVFTAPTAGSQSFESGRNFLTRNPINSWDMSLTKRFRFTERAKVELRLDAFNALNHTQLDAVNATLNVAGFNNPTPTNLPFDANGNLVNKNGFGTISSVRPPRNLQISARFEF
jgi:hypothetical protein